MFTSNQRQIVMVLIFNFLCVPMLGAEPNGPHPALEFKIATPAKFNFIEPPPIMPTHRAEIDIWWYHTKPETPNGVDLLKTPSGKSISNLQRGVVEAKPSFWVDTDLDRHWGGSDFEDFQYGNITYHVFAVSEADARKMAQALVEFLTQERKVSYLRAKKDHIEKLLTIQRQSKANLVKVREQAEAKDAERDSAYQEYKEAVAASSYSLHPINEVRIELRKTIFEMNKMLDVLNIEITGIRSKISAIKKYSTQKDVSDHQTLRLAIREMAIREEIELVGAESRQQATISTKKREQGLYRLYRMYYGLGREAQSLRNSVTVEEKKLKALERELAILGLGELSFKVEGNKVLIRQGRTK